MAFNHWMILLFSVWANITWAHGESLVELDHAPLNIENRDQLLRGAKHFQQVCLTCHSMHYLRYDDITQEAGIIKERMPVWDDLLWGGRPPPDLSLIVKRRTADWLYTFLRAYYIDDTRPTGVNNLVWPNTSMPNPFISRQGTQQLLISEAHLHDSKGKYRWSQVLKLDRPGQMSGEEFDQYIDDIVNYLVYAADPSYLKREAYGPWVIGYLLILLFFVARLSMSYWDDVKRKHHMK